MTLLLPRPPSVSEDKDQSKDTDKSKHQEDKPKEDKPKESIWSKMKPKSSD